MASLVAAVLVAVTAGGCGGPMTSGELRRSVETLKSNAAEGKLLAQGAAEDRTKATFVRALAREVGESTDHETEKLTDAVAREGLEEKMESAVALAEAISDQVGTLQVAPADTEGASDAAGELDDLAARARRLAASL